MNLKKPEQLLQVQLLFLKAFSQSLKADFYSSKHIADLVGYS